VGGVLRLFDLGSKGVNVDDDPLALADQEYLRTQNVISDPLLAGGLSKRPGFAFFSTRVLSGPILGGIGLPFSDLSPTSALFTIYIGRGPFS
jgi:hypothetical protein